jgi:hypothetical protein
MLEAFNAIDSSFYIDKTHISMPCFLLFYVIYFLGT